MIKLSQKIKNFYKTFIPASKLKEHPLVVIIPSYNNAQWYKKNLDSVFNQRYSNYRIIYLDDASTDQTGYLVEKYIQEKIT